MAQSNQNNRPDCLERLGNINSTRIIYIYYAHKAVLLRGTSLFTGNRIGGDASNFLMFRLQDYHITANVVNNIGPFVSTAQFLDQRILHLDHIPEYELQVDHVLRIDVTEVGSYNWRDVLFARLLDLFR